MSRRKSARDATVFVLSGACAQNMRHTAVDAFCRAGHGLDAVMADCVIQMPTPVIASQRATASRTESGFAPLVNCGSLRAEAYVPDASQLVAFSCKGRGYAEWLNMLREPT